MLGRRALSHPNIVQAYTCLTDVAVRDMLAACFRVAPPSVTTSPAYKYLTGEWGRRGAPGRRQQGAGSSLAAAAAVCGPRNEQQQRCQSTLSLA